MASVNRIALNVGMNWIAMAISMVIPFFLTPYVIQHLGVTAYGIWILAMSTVSYLTILDLGLRSAIIRFVSKAEAQGKPEDARSAIGTALWFRLIISTGVAVLSVLLAASFPHFFAIPADLRTAGQITVLLCAIGVAITLTSGVFSAVLAATHRFDVLSSISALQTLARAGGVIALLKTGHGLVPLACWELTVVSLSGLTTAWVALKVFPPCRVRLRRPEMAMLSKLWSYSLTTFIFIIATQVIINTDNLVVGAFVSIGMVPFYSIGGSLMSYSSQVVTSMSTTFTPMASNLEAAGKAKDLQRLLLRGTQVTLGVALPISFALVLRGKTFIGLWMGPQYSQISGTVLQILIISQFFSVANGTATSVVMAIDKHKPLAYWSVAEAALNLGLTLVLVKTIGIYGVAWGTSIAITCVHLVFWPRYVHKVLGVSPGRFVWEGWLKILLCALPYAVACLVTDRLWHAGSILIFFLQILAILPVYALSVLAGFHHDARNLFQKWRLSRAAIA